jgi:hypothetical protein
VFADSAYRGNHFRDAVLAKGGVPRIVAAGMWGRDEQESTPRVGLSITHNFAAYHCPERDVGEAGQSAPHDCVTRRRIAGAGEIAAEPGDLGQII